MRLEPYKYRVLMALSGYVLELIKADFKLQW
jgi:hypothetical protein